MQHRERSRVCVCMQASSMHMCGCVYVVSSRWGREQCLLVVELLAVDLISYSDCLTGFCKPHSPPYIITSHQIEKMSSEINASVCMCISQNLYGV